MEKQFDVICMGRVAADLYSQQIGACLEGVSNSAKYLGGSSGNVAYGTACQGLRSSMLVRAGDEHMGRFLWEKSNQVGCDTSHLIIDKERLTTLALLGIKDRDTFPLIFYRDNCADMAITASDMDKNYIASARCIAITGTHLSHSQTREAVLTVLNYARRHGVRMMLDIDYRPVLWGLTSLGDGETRFTAAEQVTRELQEVLHLLDVVVGTEEEFHIAGGSTDTLQTLAQVRHVSKVMLVCKHGALGCSVYTDAILPRLDDGLTVTGVCVEVLNVLSAGDAFMPGLLRGYLNDEGWEQVCRYANACGVLVISRRGRAPAMPSRIELDGYLSRAAPIPRPNTDPRLNHLHRVTTRRRERPELCVMALDHRSQLKDMALQYDASLKRIPALKQLILQAGRETASSARLEEKTDLLCDDTFGQDALNVITGEGRWIGCPIRLSGSHPLGMEHGNIGIQLISWPQEHVVKYPVFFHPKDAHGLRLEQKQRITKVYHARCQPGHELLLEVVLLATMPHSDELYLRAISRFYNLGIYLDRWKLPPFSAEDWTALSKITASRDPHCRGVVILGLDVPAEQLRADFKAVAGQALVKGFAAGRTLSGDASRVWLKHDIDDMQLMARIWDNYLQLIAWWRERGYA